MRAPSRHLLRLIAALLLLQWGMAMGHCLVRHGQAGMQVEICSTDGTRHVLVDADGKELPPQAQEDGVCVSCPVPHAMAVPEPARLAQPTVYALILDAPAPAGMPPAPARAPPQQPRAPPTA